MQSHGTSCGKPLKNPKRTMTGWAMRTVMTQTSTNCTTAASITSSNSSMQRSGRLQRITWKPIQSREACILIAKT